MRTRSGRIVQTSTTSRYAHVKTPVLDQLVLDITRYYAFANPSLGSCITALNQPWDTASLLGTSPKYRTDSGTACDQGRIWTQATPGTARRDPRRYAMQCDLNKISMRRNSKFYVSGPRKER